MKKINFIQFKEMFESGVNNLLNSEDIINELNVFPVPDGDTGTNMGMTFLSGISAASKVEKKEIGKYISKFAKGSLMGARGNSGVISSQIIKGISNALNNVKDSITIKEFVSIFKPAKKTAYLAVQEPVEGTILTVIKDLSESKIITDGKFNSFEDMIKEIKNQAQKTTDYTPELLEILKESEVVDSGAYGIAKLFEGMHLYLIGQAIERKFKTSLVKEEEEVHKADANKNIGYCTEFIMTLKDSKKSIYGEIQKYLETLGDSIVLVQDEDILKVHIHTKDPGKVMSHVHNYGEFSKIKIDNMTTQVDENHANEQRQEKIAIIAVANGSGIIEEFKESGVKKIVEGGQSMNPSTENFIDAINQTSAKNIIVLPNNSNIIMAAEQAAKTFKKSDKKVHIIKSKTIPQGLSAVYNFSADHNIKQNLEAMNEAIKNTVSSAITKAIKNTTFKNIKIKKDNFISIVGKEIITAGDNLEKVIEYTLTKIVQDNSNLELFTIFLGEDAPKTLDGKKIEKFVEDNLDVEAEIREGTQPVYHCVIMGE